MKFGTIRQTIIIDAQPFEVYEAYADPEKQTTFTGDEAKGRPRVGGRFTAGGDYIFGKFVDLIKGEKIVQSWTTTEWPEGYPPSRLELRFKSKGKKTELTMIHSKVPAADVEKYAEGWQDYYWQPLKKYFEKS